MESIKDKFIKAFVYIDGYNLYHSVKGTSYLWLNIEALVNNALIPEKFKIMKIKYFTAKTYKPESANRQKFYLEAIKTLKNVEIIFGKFKKKFSKNGNYTYEEKETDVNIATHIIYDCCKEDIGCIVLLSNDTDFKLPLFFVRKKLNKRILIITPSIKDQQNKIVPQNTHYDLQKISNYQIKLNENHLKKSLFPLSINGIFKPKEWKYPLNLK